jgi:serine phosphatase RsbU (regulator of sigma subunit)
MRLTERLARARDNLHARKRIFLAMPWRSQILLYVVVFCTCAAIGVLPTMMMLGAMPVRYVLLYAGFSGSVGVIVTVASLRTIKSFAAAAAFAIVAELILIRWVPTFHAPTSLDAAGVAAARARLGAIMAVALGGIIIAYRAVFTLIGREGRRYWGAHAEIQLAHGIHHALVPPVAGEGASLAWCGVSHPSGEVGGDLVDVIDRPDGPRAWIGCVADVSGHGVAAGLVMAMFKTALRGAVDDAADTGALVTRVNAVLAPLCEPNMFVTAAVLRRVDARAFECVLAGHPPFLCWRAHERRTEWVGEPQLAMCLAPDTRYVSRLLAVAPGDLVVAVTDGLLEVFDAADHDLGRAGVAHALDGIDETTALGEIERRLFEACRRHGRQTDDQTALIVRVGPEAA